MDPKSPEAMLQMLRRGQTASADYWRRLVPGCTITDNPFAVAAVPYAVAEALAARHLACLRKEGYFVTPPLLEPAEIETLRACVQTVTAAGHPARYALLFDQFYRVLSRLGGLLGPVLGAQFQMVPDEPDAYDVAAADDAAGTSPHRDSLRTKTSVDLDGTPTLVNVWIPLTDVTPPGSCMYVLPAHADPAYPRALAAPQVDDEDIALRGAELQSVRAVPAPAGSVMCWSTHLIHWGARSSELAPGPRVSFAMYFQSRRAPPYHAFTMDLGTPLPFDYRLYLVEKVVRDPRATSTAWRHLQKYVPPR